MVQLSPIPRWTEQYDRVRRWHERVSLATGADATTDVDDLYAFFVFCYHLKDFIGNDDTLPPAVRAAVETFVSEDRWLSIAGDLANGVKHLQRRTYRVDPGAHLSVLPSVFQSDTFDEAAFQVRDQIVVVVQGEYHNAFEVANACFAAWNGFLFVRDLM